MGPSRSHFVEQTGSCAGSRVRRLVAASRTQSLALTLLILNPPVCADGEVSRLPLLLISDNPRDPVDSIQSTAQIDRSSLGASNKSDLDQVLRGLPGVTLQRSSRGSLSSFTLRGAASGQGQLMLDGVPLYSTLTGIYNLDGFAPELLENAEVERGPAGIRFGSQALGGSVRLSSRSSEKSGLGLHVQGGSYGTLSESVTGSLVSERARATGVFRREDVFEGISQANVDNGNPERDGYWGNLALFRYAAKPVDNVGLDGTFYHGLTRAKIDSPGLTPSGRPGPMDDLGAYGRTETWLGQQTLTVRLSPVWESSLKLGYHRSTPRVQLRGVTGEGLLDRFCLDGAASTRYIRRS